MDASPFIHRRKSVVFSARLIKYSKDNNNNNNNDIINYSYLRTITGIFSTKKHYFKVKMPIDFFVGAMTYDLSISQLVTNGEIPDISLISSPSINTTSYKFQNNEHLEAQFYEELYSRLPLLHITK